MNDLGYAITLTADDLATPKIKAATTQIETDLRRTSAASGTMGAAGSEGFGKIFQGAEKVNRVVNLAAGAMGSAAQTGGQLATTGTAIGSSFGPLGMVIGGVIGALGGLALAVMGESKAEKDAIIQRQKFNESLIDMQRDIEKELQAHLDSAYGVDWSTQANRRLGKELDILRNIELNQKQTIQDLTEQQNSNNLSSSRRIELINKINYEEAQLQQTRDKIREKEKLGARIEEVVSEVKSQETQQKAMDKALADRDQFNKDQEKLRQEDLANEMAYRQSLNSPNLEPILAQKSPMPTGGFIDTNLKMDFSPLAESEKAADDAVQKQRQRDAMLEQWADEHGRRLFQSQAEWRKTQEDAEYESANKLAQIQKDAADKKLQQMQDTARQSIQLFGAIGELGVKNEKQRSQARIAAIVAEAAVDVGVNTYKGFAAMGVQDYPGAANFFTAAALAAAVGATRVAAAAQTGGGGTTSTTDRSFGGGVDKGTDSGKTEVTINVLGSVLSGDQAGNWLLDQLDQARFIKNPAMKSQRMA